MTLEKVLEENSKQKKLIEQFKGLLDSIPDPVFMKDEDLKWIYGNPVILNLYNIDKDNYIGKTEDQLLPEEFADSCMESDRKAVAHRTVSKSTERARDEFDKIHFYEVFKVPFYEKDDTFRGLIGVGRDITERKEAQEALEETNKELETELNLRKKLEYENELQKRVLEQQSILAQQAQELKLLNEELKNKNELLKELAATDQLTKLYNRAKLDETLVNEINRTNRYAHTFGIIIIDVDHFKKINDTHGHLAGDKILKEFALILESSIRKTDTLGRWGGEEFLIICSETELNGILKLAENLRSKIESYPFSIESKKTASFGVSLYKQNENIDELIKRADDALYKAKEEGRNKVISL